MFKMYYMQYYSKRKYPIQNNLYQNTAELSEKTSFENFIILTHRLTSLKRSIYR